MEKEKTDSMITLISEALQNPAKGWINRLIGFLKGI